MAFEIRDFGKSSNFDFSKKFKNFDNKPKVPSIYPRGSDGYQLESEVKFIIKILYGLDGEEDMNYM